MRFRMEGLAYAQSVAHTAVLFLLKANLRLKDFCSNSLSPLFTLPVFPFSVIIKHFVLSEDTYLGISATPYIKPFVVWLITSLFIAATPRWFARMVEEKEERKFHLAIYWVVISIAAIIGFTFLLGGKQDYLYWGLSCIRAPCYPQSSPVLFSPITFIGITTWSCVRRSVFLFIPYPYLDLPLYYFGIKN